MEPRARRKKRPSRLPILLLGLCLALIGVGAFVLLRNYLQAAAPPPQHVVQEIHLIRPPPPPLEPPPPPPPPEKVQVPEPQQRPEPAPTDQPPPGNKLGLDTDASGPGDAFGLAAIKGGHDLLAPSNSAFTWYSRVLSDEIKELLTADKRTRSASYTATIGVWLRQDGTVERTSIVKSSGNEATDQAIKSVLSRFQRSAQAPPPNWPNPANVTIVSHG